MGFRVNKIRSLLLAALVIFVAVRWLHAPSPHLSGIHPRDIGSVIVIDQRTGSSVLLSEQSAHEGESSPARVRDLSIDEMRGGHTLARHVGRSDEQLRERLILEEISAASTWPDRATAERIVTLALARDTEKIVEWKNRSGPRPNLALHYRGDEVIGRSLRPGAKETRSCRNAVIVLKWAGTDWFVLTAYPD